MCLNESRRNLFGSKEILRRIVCIFMVALFFAVFYSNHVLAKSDSRSAITDVTGPIYPPEAYDPSDPAFAPQIDLSADQVLVLGTSRGVTLYDGTLPGVYNIPAASKIMTAVIALDALPSDTMVTVSSDIEAMDKKSPSPVFLKKGVKYSATFLVSAVIMQDSDAAALSLAEYIANDESSFVTRMNETAKNLGMANTYFVNTSGRSVQTGVPSEVPNASGLSQYTTLNDLSILFRYAESMKGFSDIFDDYSKIQFQSDGNPISVASLIIPAWGIANMKGAAFFPTAAGDGASVSCVLATAVKDNFEITVVLTRVTDETLYMDLDTLIDSIYTYYEVSPLVETGDEYRNVAIDGIDQPVASVFKSTVLYVHPASRTYTIKKSEFTPSKVVTLPISKGDLLGQVRLTLEDDTQIITEVIAKDSMKADESLTAKANTLLENNRNISTLILVCFLCLFLVFGKNIVRFFRSRKWIRRFRFSRRQ